MTRARANELVLWPIAVGLLLFAAFRHPRGDVASSAATSPRQAAVPTVAAGSIADTAMQPGAASLSPRPVESRGTAALLAPPTIQRAAASDMPAPEPAPPKATAEAAPWLRYVGSVGYGGSTVHYFGDQRTGALLRVPADGDGEWAVEAREAGGWILRRGESLYRVGAQ